MIETVNLTKKFGDLTAVDGVTFRVEDGEVFGFLGPNGAGKTTTIRMLCCLISKTSGAAKIANYDVGDDADSLKIRKIIGLVPDNVGLYDSLSAYDNLDFYAKLYKCSETQRKENIQRFLRMLGLWEKEERCRGRIIFEGNEAKTCDSTRANSRTEVLFLDEPTVNLDPESSKTVRDFLLELKKEKKTIFLNTHNLDEAQRICDKIGILNTRLMAVGTPEELEQLVTGRKTVVQLERVDDAVLNALKKLSVGKMTIDNNRLMIDVVNPEKENPAIVRAIVVAGGNVQSVSVTGSTLEDAYLKLVKETK